MLNYVNRVGNPATFETLEEVRQNAPAVTAKLSGNNRFPQIVNPKLDDFPQGLVYIYRLLLLTVRFWALLLQILKPTRIFTKHL